MNDRGDCRTAPATPGLLNIEYQNTRYCTALVGHVTSVTPGIICSAIVIVQQGQLVGISDSFNT